MAINSVAIDAPDKLKIDKQFELTVIIEMDKDDTLKSTFYAGSPFNLIVKRRYSAKMRSLSDNVIEIVQKNDVLLESDDALEKDLPQPEIIAWTARSAKGSVEKGTHLATVSK